MFFLNANIKNTEQEVEAVKSSKYTHIFISPKLASTLDVHPLLQDPDFKRQLALIVVNKAYFI